MNSPKLFLNYVGWAKIVLHSRGISVDDFVANLEITRAILDRNAPREIAKAAGFFIDVAVQGLPELPSEIPSYISDPDNTHTGLANEYLRRILMLDSDAANAGIIEAVEAGLSIAETFQDVLHPVQREVGRLWQINEGRSMRSPSCKSTFAARQSTFCSRSSVDTSSLVTAARAR